MKKGMLITIFILIHLIVTRFIIRIVDATVQIDGNYLMLIALILVVNFALYAAFRQILRLLMGKK